MLAIVEFVSAVSLGLEIHNKKKSKYLFFTICDKLM